MIAMSVYWREKIKSAVPGCEDKDSSRFGFPVNMFESIRQKNKHIYTAFTEIVFELRCTYVQGTFYQNIHRLE